MSDFSRSQRLTLPDGEISWAAPLMTKYRKAPNEDHRALAVTWVLNDAVLVDHVLSNWRDADAMAIELNRNREENGLPSHLAPFYTWVYVIEEEP